MDNSTFTTEKGGTKMNTKERAEKTLALLEAFLANPDNDDLAEFTKGGISACCVILDRKNPYTGNKYTGDFT